MARLKRWKQYRVALNRIEQQMGFPVTVDWPTAPS
ncbi:phage tail assembly chaperone [Pseudomonas fluorescens]|nr:phage tail assembly chaperone [Pseudomonas fluorescens]